MACFIVPVVEASVVTAGIKVLRKHNLPKDEGIFSVRKLNWLKNMLWVSSGISIAEHVYHGEIIAEFPFFTALRSWDSTMVMLQEIATEGVLIALAITGIWAIAALATEYAAVVHADK